MGECNLKLPVRPLALGSALPNVLRSCRLCWAQIRNLLLDFTRPQKVEVLMQAFNLYRGVTTKLTIG